MPKRSRNEYDSNNCNNNSESDIVINQDEYNSATSVHNYMLNDPLLDYFKLRDTGYFNKSRQNIKKTRTAGNNNNNNRKKNRASNDSFLDFILEKGTSFENSVIEYLEDKVSRMCDRADCFKTVATDDSDSYRRSKFEETVNLMQIGVPFIYQGVLHDYESKTFGSPDLIVRHDYLQKIFNNVLVEFNKYDDRDTTVGTTCNITCSISDYSRKRHRPINRSVGYKYVIVEIKYNNVKLRANGVHILNYGRMVANKAQSMIYNRMLTKLQGTCSRYTYIMGRSYTSTKAKTVSYYNKCDSRLGHVDTVDIDSELNERIDSALIWLTNLKKNGTLWNLNSEGLRKVTELCPNMCNTYDMPWHQEKKELAERTKEITSLWSVGYKNRLLANTQGFYSWNDPGLTSQILGINGSRKIIVDKMLQINTNESGIFMVPEKIKNNIYNWKNISTDLEDCDSAEESEEQQNEVSVKSPELEFFLDFETTGKVFDSFKNMPETSSTDTVFMIGLTVSKCGQPLEYYNFTAEEISEKGQLSIFRKFYELLYRNIGQCTSRPVNIYHWGSFEKTVLKRINEKYPDLNRSSNYVDTNVDNIVSKKKSSILETFDYRLCDLSELFKQEPIIIKKCFNFSLKEISTALSSQGLIDISWPISKCSNGLDAMVLANKYYNNLKECNGTVSRVSRENKMNMKNIQDYNKVDCNVMSHMLNYLRLYRT